MLHNVMLIELEDGTLNAVYIKRTLYNRFLYWLLQGFYRFKIVWWS